MSLCDSNCNFKGYNDTTKKGLCECNIINKFLNGFKYLKYSHNFNIMKCFYTLFSKEGLKNNIGFYFTSALLLFTIILSILFKLKGYNKLILLINEIIENKKVNIENKIMKIKNNPPLKKNRYIINIMKTNDEIANKSNSKFELRNSNNINNNKKKQISKYDKFILKGQNRLAHHKKLNNYEINNLKYQEALRLDKRNYFQFYFSLLKMNHIIVFTFFNKNDCNSGIIKCILFLFSFDLYFAINALFFNEETLDQIYNDQGNFNFVYQLPQIIYSTVISSFIIKIIKYLSLTENNILKLKEKKNINEQASKLFKCLFIKFLLFFILIFIFLILIWYYLSCFCAVYRNTQNHLLKDTLTSYGLSILYPFITSLLPGLLRIPSLNNKNREILYKISKIMQLI